MKKTIKYIFVLLSATIVFTGCSRKKDQFLNRNWHALNTKFNVLYNGNLALENGLKSIESNYADNFWDILPIERLSVSDPFALDAKSQNPDFERAEEKAVKAVQTHGMNIRGKEKNPQIDEAYILLGKSRYYSGRFIPALEAFNYVLFKYPGSSNINSAKIWRAKTNLQLDNEAIALENLNKLLTRKDISKDHKIEASATLAQLYIKQGVVDSALVHLQLASELTNNNALKGRLYFIEGQLYNQKNQKDSANLAFQKVIELNRKVPRAYRVNAFLEQIMNFDYKTGNLETLSKHMESIESDRENRPFLDRIFYVTANHHRTLDNDSLAIDYYNKSLRTETKDTFLKAKNYQSIADIYFDNSAYSQAGIYYDSTLVNYRENSKPYRAVKKRLDNLQDVILYESIAQRNDSILRLTEMSNEERIVFFENVIERLKISEEKKNRPQTTPNTGTKSTIGTQIEKTGGFYFYQPTTVAFGKIEFSRVWGERPLADNWRWSNNKKTEITSEGLIINSDNNQAKETLTASYYIEQIPEDAKVIDSISKQRNFAYYQLGLIYKNKFKDYQKSREKLEFLLQQNIEERLVLPAKYNLYKNYTLIPIDPLASQIKQEIITEYPLSRYAQILQNPAVVLEADSQSPTARYQALFKLFENNQFQEVIEGCDREIARLEGESMIPKFELLKTSAKGRLYGLESYKKGLNYIALNYPNTEEGKQASEIIEDLSQQLPNAHFDTDETSQSFKTIYSFKTSDRQEIDTFIISLEKAVEGENILNLSISEDVYDINTTFVVVHGLKSINGARGFVELLKIKNPEITAKSSFAISADHYAIIQIYKNLDQYFAWVNK